MPIDEALTKLGSTVKSLEEMTKQTIEHPETLWGAAFIIDRIDGKLISKKEEDFYPLR